MIIATREMLAGALSHLDWQPYDHEPANASEVPCFVVGRPTYTVIATGRGQLYTITCPVWVLGRRDGDEDASKELDTNTDAAVEAIAHVASVTAVRPSLKTVAELTYPAYEIDCVTGQGAC